MKNGIRFLMGLAIAGIFCMVLTGTSFAQNIKVGYVNFVKVFYSYNKTQQDMKKWQTDQTTQDNNLTSLQNEIKTLQDNYNKQKNLLKPAEAKKEKTAIREKLNELISLENNANQKLTHEKDAMITELKTKIDDIVKNFAQKEKYDLILDSQAVLYSSGDNLTNQIISILNQGETKTKTTK
jgi:outer membrane protein